MIVDMTVVVMPTDYMLEIFRQSLHFFLNKWPLNFERSKCRCYVKEKLLD